MKKVKDHFCMSEFKPAIGALTILVVVVIGWSIWNLKFEQHAGRHNLALTAAATPPAKPIAVNQKMLHPYWGNCNKCHITIDVPTQSVSKVFAGPPISIAQPMLHDYWGNCNLCHQVTDGFQPPATTVQLAAATPPPPPPITADAKATHPDWGPCANCHEIIASTAPAAGAGQPAAFFSSTPTDTGTALGLEVKAVNAAQMIQMGLANEDGALVLAVTPGSPADLAGIQKGDEIIRIGNIRVENMIDYNAALAQAQPGQKLKVNLFRGKKGRNFFIKVPDDITLAAAATLPQQAHHLPTPFGMGVGNGQMQMINTPTYPMGVGNGQMQMINTPTYPMGVGNGQMQMINTPGLQAAGLMQASGKIAVAVDSASLSGNVYSLFEASPYFVVYDPAINSYKITGNPNFNDATGRGMQTGQLMADLEISNVIAGSYSTEAYDTLRSLRINVYSGVTGPANQALSLYMAGQLRPTTIQPPAAQAAPAQGTTF